ncbi:MAG: Holliday junction branch migration protein RuvA [Planctomycetota bacterium]
MITRLTGTLTDLAADRATLDPGQGVVYEVLLPSFASQRLSISLGKPVTLHTLYYLESQNQGATFLPRLAGFLSPQDKAFFELFVTVKGIGNRKALRAMVLPTHQLAMAIADRDLKLLQTMPEIGKKMAETIAVTLRDKVDRYLDAPRPATPGAPDAGGQASEPTRETGQGTSLSRSVVEVLVQLGEPRVQALAWVDEVLSQQDAPKEVDAVIAAVYRLKTK